MYRAPHRTCDRRRARSHNPPGSATACSTEKGARGERRSALKCGSAASAATGFEVGAPDAGLPGGNSGGASASAGKAAVPDTAAARPMATDAASMLPHACAREPAGCWNALAHTLCGERTA